LHVPIVWDRPDLRGCGTTGSLRLEAVDTNYRPVNAPVAYVDIADEDPGARRAVSEDRDLVRTAFEAQTRMVEAMQRTQVEHERASAQEKRALTEALVAKERINAELIIALAERASGGKPQNPVDVLNQGLAFKKAIEGTRNAGRLFAAPVASTETETPKDPTWLEVLRPLLPVAAGAATEWVANRYAKGDEAKAKDIRNSFGQWAQSLIAMSAAAAAQSDGPQQPTIMNSALTDLANAGAPLVVVSEGDTDDDDDESRPTPPKAVREVQAQLEDEDAEKFEEYLDGLDEDEFERVCEEARSMPRLDERIAWVRGLVRSFETEPEKAEAPQAPVAQVPIDGIPPTLIPVLSQLTPEERLLSAQMVSALDRATVEKLLAKLQSLPTVQAVAAVREAIAAMRLRAASIAQRAVAVVLGEDSATVSGSAS
jgi:hypothetical protein